MESFVEKMIKAVQALQKDLAKIRTGRASPALVEDIPVEYYGSKVPLKQISNIAIPDARTIQVVPWEANQSSAIEKAILAANIGLTPQSDGKIIRIPTPAMTEERRKDLVKVIHKMAEETRVSIRSHRREANETIKKSEKDKSMGQDEAKKVMDMIQKKTDEKIMEVDKIVTAKEKDILSF